MSEPQTHLEVIAPTVEEAVEKGLIELGLTADEVEIDILDPGSRGLFGLGSRQARVRLSLRGTTARPELVRQPEEDMKTVSVDDGEIETGQQFDEPGDYPILMDQDEEDEETEYPEDEELDQTLQVCGDVVRELLAKMKVRAQVHVRYAKPEDERSKQVVWVDVKGSDLSILIGPRAETLNALQYIASLIASKELGHTLPMVVDVEGFRARRSQQLRQLARRMADQAVKTGRRQVLEPMPANERRIIHIELRNNPMVTTESIGEEPRRKVTINPK